MPHFDLYQILRFGQDCVAQGILQAERMRCPANDLVSQRQAFAIYGETKVKRWLKKGLIQRHQKGTAANSKILLSLADMLALHNAERQLTLLNSSPPAPSPCTKTNTAYK